MTHKQPLYEADEYRNGEGLLRRGRYEDVLSDVADLDLILTSPPYNIGSGGPRQDGYRRKGEFDRKSFAGVQSYFDTWPEPEYQRLQQEFLIWAMERLTPDGVLAYSHKNRHQKKRLITPYEWIIPLVSDGVLKIYEEIVWDRGSTHNHDKHYLYPETERIYVLAKPNAKPYFRNYDPAGVHKGMSDVWRIERSSRRVRHDAAFPLELAQRVVKCYTQEGALVCDPYSGSGTTFVAAVSLGRRFVGSELSAEHFATAKDRIGRDLRALENPHEQLVLTDD